MQHAGSHVNNNNNKKAIFSWEEQRLQGAGASLLPPQGEPAHSSIPQALEGVQALWLGQMDRWTEGFLLCSCFSELQKASEQLELRHLTSMQQNKTNHAGSQLGLPVNQSNCTFIGSDGPGCFSRAGKSSAAHLVVFLPSGFLPWRPPPLRNGFTPWPAAPGAENRGDRAARSGAAHQAGVLLLLLALGSPALTGTAGALLHTSSWRCPQESPFPTTDPAGCSLCDGRKTSEPSERLPALPITRVSWG